VGERKRKGSVRKSYLVSNFSSYYPSSHSLSPSYPLYFANTHRSFVILFFIIIHRHRKTRKRDHSLHQHAETLQVITLTRGYHVSAMYLRSNQETRRVLQYCSNLPTSFRTTVHNRFPIPPWLIIYGLRPHRSHHQFSLLSRQLHRELQSIGGFHLTLLHQATMTDYPGGNSP
jgi:hypothetical protein